MAEGEDALKSVPHFTRAIMPTEGFILMTSSKLNYHPNAPPPNTITLGVQAQLMNVVMGKGLKHSIQNTRLRW